MNFSAPRQIGHRNKARQSGKSITLVLIAAAAAALGATAFNTISGKPDHTVAEHTRNAVAADSALAALQDNLQTSLALPTDFKTVPDFQLLDVDAQPLTQSVFEDHWSLVFFGFTHCPDVCPVTLQVMKEVVNTLKEQQQTPPQIVFVSVDPVRDTSAVLKQYVGYFDDSFVGITGDVNEIHRVSSALGVVASFTANDTDPENYGVDHTASLLLIDPQGRVRAKVTPPHEADKIMADYLVMTAAPS